MTELLLHPKTKKHAESLRNPGVYLVYGPEGIGKSTFVSSVLADFKPVTLGADDKNIIGVKAIKELTGKLHYKATKEKAAVIIDDAQAMTPTAQNAFLKTLEEMPADISAVLISHNLHGLLATVRSRCQLLYMPAPSADQFEKWLSETATNPGSTDLLQYHFTPMPAAISGSLENNDMYENIPKLFAENLYSRLAAAKQLSSALPDILPRIVAYIRHRLRESPDSNAWQRYLIASTSCIRLTEARVSDRVILDVIAMAGSSRG